MAPKSMIHLNGDLLCVVDCETTGLKPHHNDLIQICILPLDADMKPMKTVMPFYQHMKAARPENVDPQALEVNKIDFFHLQQTAFDADKVADLFDAWFQKLNLPHGKKIQPLAQNWAFDREFIIDWLGIAGFESYFGRTYRDTMVTALFLNDIADIHNEPYPFPRVNLKYLATTLKLDYSGAHDAMQDCLITAEVYRLLCRMKVGGI